MSPTPAPAPTIGGKAGQGRATRRTERGRRPPDVAAVVAPYLEPGGRLDDLLVSTPRARSPETPYRRIRRILDVLDFLLAHHPPDPLVRSRTLALLPAP